MKTKLAKQLKRRPISIPCPECDRALAVKDKSQVIGAFLEWLMNERHVSLCTIHAHTAACTEWRNGRYHYTCGCQDDVYMPFHSSIEKLLADYFNINLNKIEAEKRALLDALRRKTR